MSDNDYYEVAIKHIPEELRYKEAKKFYEETVYGKAGVPFNWEKTNQYIDMACKKGFAKALFHKSGKGIGVIIVVKSKPMFADIDTLSDLCSGMIPEYRKDKLAKQAFTKLFEKFIEWAKDNSDYPTISNSAGITNGDFFRHLGLKEVGSIFQIY
jgi:hypothetical protein